MTLCVQFQKIGNRIAWNAILDKARPNCIPIGTGTHRPQGGE